MQFFGYITFLFGILRLLFIQIMLMNDNMAFECLISLIYLVNLIFWMKTNLKIFWSDSDSDSTWQVGSDSDSDSDSTPKLVIPAIPIPVPIPHPWFYNIMIIFWSNFDLLLTWPNQNKLRQVWELFSPYLRVVRGHMIL